MILLSCLWADLKKIKLAYGDSPCSRVVEHYLLELGAAESAQVPNSE